jgi:hypothetical protein
MYLVTARGLALLAADLQMQRASLDLAGGSAAIF